MTWSRALALGSAVLALSATLDGASFAADAAAAGGLGKIETVVVIYAENRRFDNLYGHFPGANGIENASPESLRQLDRDGALLQELPPVWDGLTAKGVTPPVTQAKTAHLPNGRSPSTIRRASTYPSAPSPIDLWHRFYQNQMQIDGGKNDMFVAWADSGAMPMGNWDGSRRRCGRSRRSTRSPTTSSWAAFGGSFFNHQWLICACAPDLSERRHEPGQADDRGGRR